VENLFIYFILYFFVDNNNENINLSSSPLATAQKIGGRSLFGGADGWYSVPRCRRSDDDQDIDREDTPSPPGLIRRPSSGYGPVVAPSIPLLLAAPSE